MVEEARLEQSETGLRPISEWWFVVNARNARWMRHEVFGAGCPFGGPESGFREFGINLRVLEPGQPNGLYHRESNQEDFLVLAGESRSSLRARSVYFIPGTSYTVRRRRSTFSSVLAAPAA